MFNHHRQLPQSCRTEQTVPPQKKNTYYKLYDNSFPKSLQGGFQSYCWTCPRSHPPFAQFAWRRAPPSCECRGWEMPSWPGVAGRTGRKKSLHLFGFAKNRVPKKLWTIIMSHIKMLFMANLDLYLDDFHHFQTHPFQGNKMKFPRLVTAAIPHSSNGFPATALVMFVMAITEGYNWPLSTCETAFLKIMGS